MESVNAEHMTVYFEPGDREAAGQVQAALTRTITVLQERYGIQPPAGCYVYVMRSWQRAFFHAAAGPWKIYLVVAYPYLALRARRIWPLAGGWAFTLGRRQVLGVKPPDLLAAAAESGLGDRIFRPVASRTEKMRHIAAHEFTHTATTIIRPHTWLYEGLAMRVVDHVAGQPTVRPETVKALADRARGSRAGHRRRLDISDPDALVYTYVRGYWLTRYLDEAHPALLRDLLNARRSRARLERDLAAALHLEPGSVWSQLESLAVRHFSQGLKAATT